MVKDIMIQANQKFHFDRMIDDPNEYMTLTDNIMYLIEHTKDPVTFFLHTLSFYDILPVT